MKLLTWNVRHATGRRLLPESLAPALASVGADVVVLTEYVAQDSHAPFYDALRQEGLVHHLATTYVPGENQVFIAAREPLASGDVDCCEIGNSTRPNWLHARTPTGHNVVGFRVPVLSKQKGGRLRYWEWLVDTALPQLVSRPTILLGDFNEKVASRLLKRAVQSGWTLATPSSGWSYMKGSGSGSAIDHGMVSPHFKILKAEYKPQLNGIALAGATGAYSDHAALVLELELKS